MDAEIRLGQEWRSKASGMVACVTEVRGNPADAGDYSGGVGLVQSGGHQHWCSAEELLKHWELVDADG